MKKTILNCLILTAAALVLGSCAMTEVDDKSSSLTSTSTYSKAEGSAVGAQVNSSSADTSETEDDFIKREDAKKEKLKREVLQDQENNAAGTVTNKLDEQDLALRRKLDKIVEEENKKILREDILAYPIVAKYYGEKYNRSTIIDNFNDDEPYMKLMAELLNNKKMTNEETKVIKRYLNRRLMWMKDDREYGNEETEKLLEDVLNK